MCFYVQGQEKGRVFFFKGKIYAAEYGQQVGFDALVKILSLKQSTYKFYSEKLCRREDFKDTSNDEIIKRINEVMMLNLNKKLRLIPIEKGVRLAAEEWKIIALAQRGTELLDLIKASGYSEEAVVGIIKNLQEKGIVELVDELIFKEPIQVSRKYAPKVFWSTLLKELRVFLGPITKEIILDEVYNLGEEVENFPLSKIPLLIEKLADEIDNSQDRINFQKNMLRIVKNL